MDECGVALAREDRPERPRDRDARRQVALGGGERVRRRCGLEEETVEGMSHVSCSIGHRRDSGVMTDVMARREGRGIGEGGDIQGKECEDIGPDSSVVDRRVLAERLERGENNEDGRPAVVE